MTWRLARGGAGLWRGLFPALALVLLAACQSSESKAPEADSLSFFERIGGSPRPEDDPEEERAPESAPAPVQRRSVPPTPAKVVWEALGRERDLAASSRFGRDRPPSGMPLKITIVSESHPEARVFARATEGADEITGVLDDARMVEFLQGLDQRGYFDHARPTSGMRLQFGNSSARGRITVDVQGRSSTIVSLRGQGLNPGTRAIPPLYSEVKRAIMLLQNHTHRLRVSDVERGWVDPGRASGAD